MNRKEVMALSDEDLQIEAALLDSFEVVMTDTNGLRGYIPANDKGRGEGWQLVPDYLNDSTAAMRLWGLLEKEGYIVALYSKEGHYYCMVGRKDGYIQEYEKWALSLEGALKEAAETEIVPDNIPRAITRAFVLAMEDDE